MRILYGVQGTGNGHLTRARSLGPKLAALGLEVDYLFSGRERSKFFDMEQFGDFSCHRGLSFAVYRGQIDQWKTLRGLQPLKLLSDIRQLDVSGYDLVISDFEPITAWAARRQNIKCLSMSHQSAFDYDVPKVGGYPFSTTVMKYFAPASIKIGFHYHHFGQPVLPPLIEKQVAAHVVRKKIVVYMGFEEMEDILNFLSPFTDFSFQVFGHVSEKTQKSNITINPISHEEFHKQLRDAEGVISNAGFALSSECLALGKKLLIKPLHRQFEQLSNSLALQCLGRATIAEELDSSLLGEWLALGPHTPIAYPEVSTILATWIANSESHDIHALAEQAWAGLPFPYEYDPNFGTALEHGLLL